MINPDWLRYFLALADTRNYHAAAERLHVTPQALSKAIAGLEAHYGLPLVERGHRVRGLTPAGEALVEEARRVLAGLENADRRMAELRAGEPQGPVRVAGLDVWVNYLMPEVVKTLRERHPRVTPKFYNMLPDDVARWVAAGEVDLGLLLAPPTNAELAWAEGMRTPYVIAGKPQAKGEWNDFEYVVPRFFRREPTVALDGWPEEQFPRRIACEVEMLENAIYLCEAGAGVAFLPELAIRDRLQRGTLAIVADTPVQFADQLFVTWRKAVRLTPAATEVLAALGIRAMV